ncbi:MAG TPA: hypothetical protein VHH11_12670 [Gammaproteobacteria bacterium]|nr:hypothetical protein [Gammaproteobacteria bacterium]
MQMTKTLIAGLLLSVAGAAGACELPKLVVIPPKEDVVGKEEGIRQAFMQYRQGMETYTACVQSELTAAGGDKAPAAIKAALVQRNNVAVAEVQAVDKLFNTNVGSAPVSPGPSPEKKGK